YAQNTGAINGTRTILLSQLQDASGNVLSLSYDAQNRLITVTDALGQKSTLQYGDTQDDLLITQVTDPFGRTATLAYDDTGRLISITDVLGMVSAFTYDDGSFINTLTTPYGKSQFSYGEDGTQ
ncbi:RHS repeat protein, partial [Acidithiobacillus sp. VAN18-4]|nr:RHS repeat protein [Acidithiobacillus sp. BN09-2]MBU2798699.1 RHS repeat protein [Acidithiobacillus sp. VAN18-4]